ncbi:MAG: ABC transporter permease, partial [Acidobacteriota bacterium]
MSSLHIVDTISRDLVYALRTMRRNPVFVMTAVLTLALAIGGNTAMFMVIRAVLLNPLPYRDSDRLAHLAGGATPTRFAEMSSGARSFAELGVYSGQESLTLSGGSEPEVLKGVRVSADFLRILGVTPLRGRGFLPAEDAPGGVPVAMIGAELWQRRFGGDPRIIGRTVTLGGAPFTIVAVLPAGFQFPFSGVDVWLTRPSEFPLIPAKSRALSPFLAIFGRLRPGLSFERANAELQVLRRQYAMAHPAMLDAKPKSPVEVTAMKEELVAKARSMLWMLFGALGFVLAIACANIASLLLTRATSRAREFAVRSALGAARARLIGQLLAESVLLSVFGGALGVLLAAFALRAIPAIASLNLPRAAEIHMDWMVLGFAAALSIATGVLFGLAPSLGASRPDPINVLRGNGAGANRDASRGLWAGVNAGSLLSAGQVALSVVLLIGAALLLESVAHLRRVEVGFNPSNLLTASVTVPPLRYDTDRKKAAFFEELARRLGA